MSTLSRPEAGYEDLLRGAFRSPTQDSAAPLAKISGGMSLSPASAMDIQQMSDMLDAQFRLREAAQDNRARAIQALVSTAEALCASQWDGEKRAGNNPDEWIPEQISEFIVTHAKAARGTTEPQQADISAEYNHMARELTTAREENSRLRQQLQQAQASSQKLSEELVKATQSKRGPRTVTVPPLAAPEPVESPAVADEEPADTKELDAVPQERIDAVIKLIATTGLARVDEIRHRLANELGAHRGGSKVGMPVKAAVQRGLVESHGCVVEWPGERTRQFLVLTPAGRARAVELKIAPVENEYEAGLRLHKSADHLYLVLFTADILRAEGYGDVNPLPACIQLAEGEYCPDIVAVEGDRTVYVECERSQDKAREAKWSRAAQANGGTIRLVTPNRKIMNSITSEIKATTGSEFKIWALNISEYLGEARGQDGSIWLHRR